jgi:hypothetical protein
MLRDAAQRSRPRRLREFACAARLLCMRAKEKGSWDKEAAMRLLRRPSIVFHCYRRWPRIENAGLTRSAGQADCYFIVDNNGARTRRDSGAAAACSGRHR